MSAAQRPAATHSILLTLVISAVTTVVIGSLLYYTLKRHDMAHAQTVAQITLEARQQQALAAGRVVGALGRHLMHDVTRLQELVNTGLDSEGLRDLMVIDRDNVVRAATNITQVGQVLEDANWNAWKGHNGEVAQRAVDQAGRPVFVIMEPLRNADDVLGWAMLVFALPEQTVSGRTMMERLMETGRLMAPVFVCLWFSIGLAMKRAEAGIRRQIRGLMASVLEAPALPGGTDHWRKVG